MTTFDNRMIRPVLLSINHFKSLIVKHSLATKLFLMFKAVNVRTLDDIKEAVHNGRTVLDKLYAVCA